MQDQFRKSRILYSAESRYPASSRRFFFRRQLIFGIILVVFLVLLAFGAGYLLQADRFRIREISVNGTRSLSEEIIREAILSEIAGKSLFFIFNDSYFLVSSRDLEKKLAEKFLRLGLVSVKKSFNRVLAVSVMERDIWGIGCVKTEVEEVAASPGSKRDEPQKTVGPCFYIDKNGFAFEDVLAFEGGLLPILYKDGTGLLGEIIFQKEDILFFEETAQLLASSLQLLLLSVELSSANKEDVRLILKDGWALIVPRNKNPASWASVLKTLLAGEIRGQKSRLDYVDLRFGNKVFYKFR